MILNWLRRWTRQLSASSRSRMRGRPRPFRPQVEPLEDRVMLSADSLATPHERFVAQVAQDLLGQPVDPARLAILSGRLDQGVSRQRVVRAIEDSLESRAKQVQDL